MSGGRAAATSCPSSGRRRRPAVSCRRLRGIRRRRRCGPAAARLQPPSVAPATGRPRATRRARRPQPRSWCRYPSQATRSSTSAAERGETDGDDVRDEQSPEGRCREPGRGARGLVLHGPPTDACRRLMMYPFRLVPSRSAAWASSPWRSGGMRRRRRPLGDGVFVRPASSTSEAAG